MPDQEQSSFPFKKIQFLDEDPYAMEYANIANGEIRLVPAEMQYQVNIRDTILKSAFLTEELDHIELPQAVVEQWQSLMMQILPPHLLSQLHVSFRDTVHYARVGVHVSVEVADWWRVEGKLLFQKATEAASGRAAENLKMLQRLLDNISSEKLPAAQRVRELLSNDELRLMNEVEQKLANLLREHDGFVGSQKEQRGLRLVESSKSHEAEHVKQEQENGNQLRNVKILAFQATQELREEKNPQKIALLEKIHHLEQLIESLKEAGAIAAEIFGASVKSQEADTNSQLIFAIRVSALLSFFQRSSTLSEGELLIDEVIQSGATGGARGDIWEMGTLLLLFGESESSTSTALNVSSSVSVSRQDVLQRMTDALTDPQFLTRIAQAKSKYDQRLHRTVPLFYSAIQEIDSVS